VNTLDSVIVCFANTVALLSVFNAFSTVDDGGNEVSSTSIPWTDLMSLPELNPPTVMPQGNVGTPLSAFMALIRACKLPSHVIKKLRLEFPKSRSSKRYGAVSFEYGLKGKDREERNYAMRSSLKKEKERTSLEKGNGSEDFSKDKEQGVCLGGEKKNVKKDKNAGDDSNRDFSNDNASVNAEEEEIPSVSKPCSP